MAAHGKKRQSGRITLVQEDRFRITSDSGQSYLFTHSHSASTSFEDLIHWHRSNTHVTVEYTGEPDLESGIAQSVEETFITV